MTSPPRPGAKNTAALHILHTNDFHGSLTDTGAERLRRAVADLGGAPYLLLDAGDAIKAGNVGVNPFGEPILELMSDLGYHAMTMGNREFHVWDGALAVKINRARFPVLCANVHFRKEGATLPVQSHATFEVGGLKVAVFGVTVPMVTERMKVAALSSFVFDDPIEVARKMVAELRWGADVLIALTHIGIREDERLARSVPGIDLIVGGHSHVSLASPQREEGAAPIVQAGFYARTYGHVTLTVGQNGVSDVSGVLCPLQEQTKATTRR
jgi:2',3'-cyclic-nucleotide 2'-phosphodiesterase (5'-nucleotidase family)